MYWAKIPIQSIVIEKLRIVTPITLPNPRKGTPRMIQKIARAKIPNTDVRLRIIPITETHARGFALYERMLLKELPTTEKRHADPFRFTSESRGPRHLYRCSFKSNPRAEPTDKSMTLAHTSYGFICSFVYKSEITYRFREHT
jgi:hypothetical protein